MSLFRHILVATDFSPHAGWALRAGAGLAEIHGARLSLVHVVRPHHPLGRPTYAERDLDREFMEEAKASLEEARAAVKGEVAVQAVMNDSASAGICRVAEASEVDLVVLGTRGRGGFEHLVMGSVAEQVVRHAPCAVLTIGGEAAAEALTRNGVVVASDLSAAAAPALAAGAALARAASANLTLVHVHDPDLPYPEPGSIREAFGSREDVRRAIEERVEQAVRRAVGDASARAEVLPHASAADAICEFLEARGSELVVVASHGRTGLARVRLGSVAERLVRYAPCPVLTVRRGA